MNYFAILALVLCASQTYAFSIFGFGLGTKCPNTEVMADFDQEKYLGKWYEIERIPMVFERNLDCVTAEYGRNANGKISVRNSGTNLKANSTSVTIGEAYAPNPSEPNKLVVEFPNNILGIRTSNQGNYHVWKTDYANHALVYSCKVYIGFVKFEAAWILSRSKDINPTQLNEIKQLLATKGVDAKKFETVKQTCNN